LDEKFAYYEGIHQVTWKQRGLDGEMGNFWMVLAEIDWDFV
jgi:hypothetical protein